MQDIFDYKKITPEMLNRVSNNPVEASGCIQSLCEYLARRNSQIENLYESIEGMGKKAEADDKFVNRMTTLISYYFLVPWYKRVWRSLFPVNFNIGR